METTNQERNSTFRTIKLKSFSYNRKRQYAMMEEMSYEVPAVVSTPYLGPLEFVKNQVTGLVIKL